jgi:hypothetical protein
MSETSYDTLRLSVEIEIALSKLYRMFSEIHREDAQFWWKLAMEEGNHAAVLRTGEKLPASMFPEELLAGSKEKLSEVRRKVEERLAEWEEQPASRAAAFRQALEFESGAGELHYQLYMKSGIPEELAGIYRELNAGDLDHARRIERYMAEQGIGADD